MNFPSPLIILLAGEARLHIAVIIRLIVGTSLLEKGLILFSTTDLQEAFPGDRKGGDWLMEIRTYKGFQQPPSLPRRSPNQSLTRPTAA